MTDRKTDRHNERQKDRKTDSWRRRDIHTASQNQNT